MNCTNCGYSNDAHTNVTNNEKPSEGALTVCFNCGLISTFRKDLTLRPLSVYEIEALKEASPQTYWIVIATQQRIKAKSTMN